MKPKEVANNRIMSFGQNDTFEQLLNNNEPNNGEQKVEYSLSPYSPSKTDDVPLT